MALPGLLPLQPFGYCLIRKEEESMRVMDPKAGCLVDWTLLMFK